MKTRLQQIVKKYFPWLVLGFLLLQPLLDVATTLASSFGLAMSPGLIIRGLFMILVLGYILTQKTWRPAGLMIIGFLTLNLIYLWLSQSPSLVSNFSLTLKVFYLPVLVIFFMTFYNKLINQKTFFYILMGYLILLIIPSLTGLNLIDPVNYDGKIWHRGLFSAGNDLTAIILALSPIVLTDLIRQKKWLITAVLVVLLLAAAILIGTKAIFLGLLAITIYLVLKFGRQWGRKVKVVISASLLFVVIITTLILPQTPVFQNTLIALNYHGVESVSDIIKPEIIDKVILSERPTFLGRVADEYVQSQPGEKLFGINQTGDDLTVESDLFDIFFSIGLIGIGFYIMTAILIIRRIRWWRLDAANRFAIILLLILAVVVGHVLITPAVATILAMLFCDKLK